MRFSEIITQWPVLNGLLDELLEVPEEEREQWLASQTAITQEQRAALRGLLKLGDRNGALIEELPQFEAPANPDTDLTPGQSIGPYRLISPLGQGGMGSVWLAERPDPPRRKVAIKLPHLGWAPGLSARLKRERDILATLEHPNIARLYDAGADAIGRPYLALEYVDGTPIDEYCRAHSLSVRERLTLVLSVAGAVAYAHTRLVVHRDLKPGNILVTRSGEVRLLDFGIAKLLQPEPGSEEITQWVGRAVTVDYASPEQLRAEAIGTQSDVYSLGVTAYELLTGTKPYRLTKADSLNLDQAITKVDVPPASRVASPEVRRQLRGDLDAVLGKALKKAVEERYSTVAAFADDIRRYLADLPVSVHGDGVLYRFRKFVNRHKLQFGAATLVLVAVLMGAGVALWQAHVARIEAARADQVKDFALSIFANADVDSGTGGAATTAADLLTAAGKRIDTELKTRPDVAVELMTSIGYALVGQGKTNEAIDLLRRAIAIATRSLGPTHPRTTAAQVVLGEALQLSGEAREAAAVLRPAVEQARKQKAATVLSDGLRWLSSAQLDLGEREAAVESARQALAALPPATTRALQDAHENAWAGLANTLLYSQKPGAFEAARHALQLREQLDGGQLTEALLIVRSTYGRALKQEGQLSASLAVLNPLLTDAQKFLGPKHPAVEYFAEYLGDSRMEVGDMDGAIAVFELARSVAIANSTGGNTDVSGYDNYRLGFAMAVAGHPQEAAAHLQLAAEQLGRQVGKDSPVVLRSRSLHALMLARLGKLTEAEREFDSLTVSQLEGDDLAILTGRKAVLRSLQGRHDLAVDLAGQAVRGLQSSLSKTDLADANRILGAALLAAGKPAEAIAPLRQAADLYSTRQVTPTPDQTEARRLLATAMQASH